MLYEKIIHAPGNTFSHKVYPQFTMPWHYHPEYELIVIKTGGGKRFVGDYMDDFRPGDLVLLGANLPHYHMCYGLLEGDPGKYSCSEVIQFTDDILPGKVGQLEEFAEIADLLKRSERGIKFTNPPDIGRICRMMAYIDDLNGIKRITALFRLLDMLGRIKEYKLLSSDTYSNSLIDSDREDPVNKVYRFLTNNFKNEVSLSEIAAHVGFNPSSLCRYFKKRAQKSVFECLNDIRISFACKLLRNSELAVSQIAYESGYRNIAHFNRQFKKINGLSPSEFKKCLAL